MESKSTTPSLRIEELSKESSIDPLLAIVQTYSKDQNHLQAVAKELTKDLSRIPSNRRIYSAYDGELAVAMIQLVFNNADNDPELANGDDIAHVHNLQVRAERQGRGIGFHMMRFIEEQAKTLGQKSLTLGVDSQNTRAIELYLRMGYNEFKRTPGRTPSEEGIFMSKPL